MKKIIIYLLFTAFFFPLHAQETKHTTALIGARLHIGNGKVIEKSLVVIENDKISLVLDLATTSIPRFSAEVEQIHLEGKDIYPSFIACHTQLGLSEIEAVRATNDYYEVVSYTPNVRTAIAFNTDSKVSPTVRSNGVLIAQIAPLGGAVCGSSAVMSLEGWNWEDALIHEDGIYMNWPNKFNYRGWWAETEGYEANQDYDKQCAQMKQFFDEAFAYAKKNKLEKTDLRFEAMRSLFTGSKKLFVRVDDAEEILEMVLSMEKYGIKPVLVGATESYKIADFLAERKIAVIYTNPHSLPAQTDDNVNQSYLTPKILANYGVPFAISVNGFWQVRNLSYQAGTAAAFGLDKEKAIEAITLTPAKLLGIDNQYGSIEEGKSATLIVSEGDVLDMRTSPIILAFFNGNKVDLNNKQADLAKKYLDKYGW